MSTLMKRIITLIIIQLTTLITIVNIHATTINITKEKLIYEVTSANLNDEGIALSGWSFIGESQHFNDLNAFEGAILLDNGVEILEFPLNFYKKDITSLMRMENTSKCKENEYNQKARYCYYEYSNVGWNVFIPIESLADNSVYNIYLQMKALNSGQDYKTKIVFATEMQIMNDIARNRVVSLNSSIDNTRVTVNHDYVMVRKNPSKDSTLYYSNKSCSLTYGSALYFIKYTEYLRVKAYKLVDGQGNF